MTPLRRPIAAVGLVALLLIAWMSLRGQLGLVDAGLRAIAVLVAVRLLDTASAWWLRQAAVAAARVSTRGQIQAVPGEDGDG